MLAAGQRLHDDVLRAVHDDLGGLGGSHTLVVQHAALGPQYPQRTGAEGLAAVTQLGQLRQYRLEPLFVAVPAVVPAVEGVAVALHADLVAVVQAGQTGQGVDDGIGHAQP